MNYDPFNKKPIHELTPEDLALLESIPEGWFIEYKGGAISSKDYAKEVAALANTYGGWIFIGLDEDKLRKPTKSKGLPNIDSTKLLNSARDSILTNLSPPPTIELGIVNGPISCFGINSEHCVLVIRVPKSHKTPHIHSSGKIYIREADVSNPKSLGDRSKLDDLYNRSSVREARIEGELSAGFDKEYLNYLEVTCACISIMSDPDIVPTNNTKISFDRFCEIISDKSGRSLSLPDRHPSSVGYVARNNSEQIITTRQAAQLEYADPATFYLTLPISSVSLGRDIEWLGDIISSEFVELIFSKKLQDCRIIDIGMLISYALGLDRIINLLRKESLPEGINIFYSKSDLINVRNCVPYIKSDIYTEWCKDNTVPVIFRNEISTPWRKRKYNESSIGPEDSILTGSLASLFAMSGIPHSENIVLEFIKNT